MKNSKITTVIIVILLAIVIFSCESAAQISTGITYQSGRINQLNINYDIILSKKDSTFKYSIFSKFRYSESNIVTNRDIRNGVGLDLKPFWVLSPFIFAEYRINHFMDIDGKINALAGIKYTFLKSDDYKYSTSMAMIYEKTDFVSDYPDKEITRISLRFKAKHTFNRWTIKAVIFYKPAINNLNDYDIDMDLSIGYKLTNKLSLSVKNEFEFYSNLPNQEIEKYQNILIISLMYNLKK